MSARRRAGAGLARSLQAIGEADLEELVEVRRDDAHVAQPLEQRHVGAARLREHAPVELEDGPLAVEKGRHRHGRRGDGGSHPSSLERRWRRLDDRASASGTRSPAQCASSQFAPTPTSATSGTASVATPAMIRGTASFAHAQLGLRHLEHELVVHLHDHPRRRAARGRAASCTAIIASLIRSAAVPCIGALIAWRSAAALRGPRPVDLGQVEAPAEQRLDVALLGAPSARSRPCSA